MHFVDETTIWVKAGNGGNGCASFHREANMPRMGPDGGDGGHGGSICFEAIEGLDTLLDYVGKKHYKAQSGEDGSSNNCTGKSGPDLVLKVPTGTLIYDFDTSQLLKDLDHTDMRVRICRGGRGGKGNQNFATATHQSPRECTPGVKGQERKLRMELKLIADVGLVGLPNAGKSTLLSTVSAARPKIADYPFTTLTPQPGIVALSRERRFVMADIPGLIEGAHVGRGLGVQFLRHIERTRVVLHLLDVSPPTGWPPDNYAVIRKELEEYSPTLAGKPEMVAVTKMDLDADGDLFRTIAEELRAKYGVREVLPISAAAHQGLEALCEKLWTIVGPARAQDPAPLMQDDVTGPEKENETKAEAENLEENEAEGELLS